MLILFYILACICTSQGKVQVTVRICFSSIPIFNCSIRYSLPQDMGVATLVRGDTGMLFYITLQNVGEYIYNLRVRMLKCCEVFDENDMDCQMMKLIGGDMGFLYTNQAKNVSLLYANMYLHNRRGKCLVCIQYSSTDKNCTIETKEKIKFDTFITGETTNKSVLRGYYKSYEYSKCQTIDQDPLGKCEPVNCQMKYLGFRNYFNPKWQRCQKVPTCVSDPQKLLPDVAYVPISNTCVDLENVILPKDLKYLEEGIIEGGWVSITSTLPQANLRCHHGKYNSFIGVCQCDPGWMSSLYHKDFFEPSLGIYHMCNIQISTWNRANSIKIRMTLFVIGILGAIMAVSTILTALICNLLYKCVKVRSKKSDNGNTTATDSSSKISTGSSKKTLSTASPSNTETTTNETYNDEKKDVYQVDTLQTDDSLENGYENNKKAEEQTNENESGSNEENNSSDTNY